MDGMQEPQDFVSDERQLRLFNTSLLQHMCFLRSASIVICCPRELGTRYPEILTLKHCDIMRHYPWWFPHRQAHIRIFHHDSPPDASFQLLVSIGVRRHRGRYLLQRDGVSLVQRDANPIQRISGIITVARPADEQKCCLTSDETIGFGVDFMQGLGGR